MSETPNNEQPRDRNGISICGKPGRSGPAKGNRNALRHCLKAGKLPVKCQYIENRINALRRQLEDAVILVRGEIGIIDAANINSAVKWERHGLLAAHWLRHEVEKLSPTDRLKFSEQVAKASDNRDKAMRLLNIHRDALRDNSIESLYIDNRSGNES